jgi:peptide/nickel transport system substrate-binding protein
MSFRVLRALPFAAAALVFAAAPVMAGKSNDTLNWATNREIDTVDTFYSNIREVVVIDRIIRDMLIFRNVKTFEYEPLLAKSFKWVDDTTMEFVLREDVTFHDGSTFDADDAVYTLNHIATPEGQVMTQANVAWIKGAEKLGKYKLRLYLDEPFPAALEYLSGAISMVPDGHYDNAPKKPDGSPDYGAVPVIGTGPYKVAKSEPGKQVVLVKNANYFKGGPKGQPSIDKIVFRTITSMETQIAELLTGGLDWIWDVPKDQAVRLKPMPQVQVVNAPTMRISYVQFDTNGGSGDKHFTNIKVRKAVAHAIDRAAIANNLVGGASEVINAPCYPTQFGCTQDVASYEYDPAKAKKLLAEAGFPNGFETDIYAYRQRQYTEATIGYLAEVGIKANLKFMQYKALRGLVWENATPMNHMTWGSNSINDASAIVSHFFNGGRDDFVKDPDLIKWLETADTSIDLEVRKANYKKALEKIAEQVYWLPMFTYTKYYAYSKDLDFTPTPDEIPRFHLASWK